MLPLDISELQKAESGLTCSSLLFDAKNIAWTKGNGHLTCKWPVTIKSALCENNKINRVF